ANLISSENSEGVCLIKPQFEAGRDKVGKKGVVREAETHFEVIKNIVSLANANGFNALGLDYSPVKGPEGNIEFLLHVQKSAEAHGFTDEYIDNIVNNAHNLL
ncbi:MAG: TlyA family RNA methyltransferase, partial [Oscillospiraceae bacterium]